MKRESVAADWPTFGAPLLREIAAAFLRRRKAIAYHTGLACGREFSESAASSVERLNLAAGALCLSFWSDGAMWLAVCVRRLGRGGGWAFQDTFHGDMRDVSAEALVGMVEATLALPFGADTVKEREQLRAVWSRVRPHAG
ncbi:MAG: hypothetical protein ACRELG_12570 [Gemmataceae bacterium]